MLRLTLLAALLICSSIAFAGSKTVTLSIPGMYCQLCPATVKKAISKVDGVSKVDASFKSKEAVVTYDDNKTSVNALIKATANAGYPSTVKR